MTKYIKHGIDLYRFLDLSRFVFVIIGAVTWLRILMNQDRVFDLDTSEYVDLEHIASLSRSYTIFCCIVMLITLFSLLQYSQINDKMALITKVLSIQMSDALVMLRHHQGTEAVVVNPVIRFTSAVSVWWDAFRRRHSRHSARCHRSPTSRLRSAHGPVATLPPLPPPPSHPPTHFATDFRCMHAWCPLYPPTPLADPGCVHIRHSLLWRPRFTHVLLFWPGRPPSIWAHLE